MPFLKEAVESILSQTYKNFEFIIVDDASVDNSWDYLKSLRDRRIKLIKNRANLGLAASMNIALRQAQGEYVARMDADDISYRERLKIQLQFLEKNKKTDLCGSWVTLTDQSGKIVGSNKRNPIKDQNIKRLLGLRPTIIHPTFFARKKFFLDSGAYDKNFDGAEEYELLCRAQNQFTYANIPKELIYWRLRDDRRSMIIMDKMYYLDIKIKKENIKKNGLNLYNFYGLSKMLILHYLIPLPLKKKMARILEIA